MRLRKQEKTSQSTSSEQTRRTSRKRRASSASDAPLPQSSQSAAASSSQPKRRKRGDALHDHPEEITLTSEHADGLEAVNTPVPASRHVHFTESAVEQGDKATSTHLTPHIRKTASDRRQTLSPSKFDRLSTPKNKSRLSLPSTLASPDSPASKLFRPLSQVLSERVKSRLRRSRLSEEIKEQRDGAETHQELMQLRQEIAEIEDLIRQRLHQLDVEQQLGEDADDDKLDQIQAELTELNAALAEKQTREAAMPDVDAIDHVDVINEDMMIFDSSQSISYPQLPSENHVRTIQRSSDTVDVADAHTQVALPDSTYEDERRSFKEAIQFWTNEASRAKSTLQVLTIQLQSLGFPGADADTIFSSIRDSFASVRERLEAAVPGQVPTDITNSDLVELVIQHLESLADKVIEQEQFLNDNDTLRKELVKEIDGLVERLSQAEIRKRTLEIGFNELDAQSQRDEQLIDSLDKQLKKIEQNHDMAQTLITEKKAKLAELDRENRDQESTIKKLGDALEGYRVNELNLQNLIDRMAQDNEAKISELTRLGEDAVADLEEQLREEGTKRHAAEADADDKQLTITELERRTELDEANIDALKQQLATLEAQKDAEHEARETAEGENEEKAAFIADLEVKIAQAESDLDALRHDLNRLRELHTAEQRQREAAEAELDDSNNKIGDLETKLLAAGQQANELRQKLFEVQQREKKTIADLEAEASSRDQQFQDDMKAEVQRRIDTQDLLIYEQALSKELTAELNDTEERMNKMVNERDEKITEFAARVDKLEEELDQTNRELDTALNDLHKLQQSSEARIAELVADVADLQSTIARHEATIATLNAQAETTAKTHATAIGDRDERIADLNHGIYEAQSQIKSLETEKASLERRVEAEAEAMLELQADRDDQISALNNSIRAKQKEIEDLGHKAQEVDRSWERVMNERNTEISELRTTTEENNSTISRLSKLNAALKEKFRLYVRDSTATVQAMQEEFETAFLANQTKSGELREEGRRVLEEVEAMDTIGEIVTAGSSSSSAVLQNPRVKMMQGRRSRRQYDSGIGVDEESSMLEMEE